MAGYDILPTNKHSIPGERRSTGGHYAEVILSGAKDLAREISRILPSE
jgi:hypothetical protein